MTNLIVIRNLLDFIRFRISFSASFLAITAYLLFDNPFDMTLLLVFLTSFFAFLDRTRPDPSGLDSVQYIRNYFELKIRPSPRGEEPASPAGSGWVGHHESERKTLLQDETAPEPKPATLRPDPRGAQLRYTGQSFGNGWIRHRGAVHRIRRMVETARSPRVLLRS